MADKEAVIAAICRAFDRTEYPGDAFLVGSSEGCEPLEEVGPFRGRQDWQGIVPEFLDAHGGALCFFSEGGFRYFLPAYLVADLRGQLSMAEPLFHLTHGFSDLTVQAPTTTRVFLLTSGKSSFVNPRRYGALTCCDSARYRLSVFAREEAAAIVAYLTYKRDHDPDGLDRAPIDAALTGFWLERAQTAPLGEELRQHVREQEEYLAAIRADRG